MVDIDAKRAIEALRSGVPSPSACREMGTTQTELLQRFSMDLESVDNGLGTGPLAFEANFGDGKSHLLHVMRERAEQFGFVTSLVVVGAEMPLGSPHLVLKAISEEARAPGRPGKATVELYYSAKRASVADLRLWARTAAVEDRFRALLQLLSESKDEELRREVLADLEGYPIAKTKLAKALKEIGAGSSYELGNFRKSELGRERIALLAQFFRAYGTKGLVVFFDEVERLERFTFRARLAAYEELGWWSRICKSAGCRLYAVFAHTSGAMRQCLEDKGDRGRIGSGSVLFLEQDRDILVGEGIELLDKSARLERATSEDFERISFTLRQIYERAYGITPKASTLRKDFTSLRAEIRRSITLWDLERHYPGYHADISESEVAPDLESIADSDLEREEE